MLGYNLGLISIQVPIQVKLFATDPHLQSLPELKQNHPLLASF
jgi:hypothetical protein